MVLICGRAAPQPKDYQMHSHLELSMHNDIERIKGNVTEMSVRVEKALQDCLKAFTENNRKLAYAVILRDQYVDEKEKEIDRLCLEFIVRQQPVAQPLRMAYSTIKINLEIERVGDYAESIARHLSKLHDQPIEQHKQGIVELAMVSIGMFHDAIQAYLKQNAELARATIVTWDTADSRRTALNNLIISEFHQKKLPFEALDPLMTIIRRFERVADQARNISLEVLYMCTGEYAKHPGAATFRVLFVDEQNSCLSQMAEAIAEKMQMKRFVFSSAGIDPRPIDRATVEFMKTKGLDLSRAASKAIHQVPNLDNYQVVIALSQKTRHALPQRQRKAIILDWQIDHPCAENVSGEKLTRAYEKVYQFLFDQIKDLVDATVDTEIRKVQS
jgi:phosphate transport system protein